MEVEQIPRPDAGAFPFRAALLALLSVQSGVSLASDRELLGVITHLGDPDLQTSYFATLIDAAVVSFGMSFFLNQAGIIRPDPASSVTTTTLNGMECQCRLNIGREPGTWMAKDWAASGARLSIPMTLRFSDEIVDVGFPGEEALDPAGCRFAKKVVCDGGSFVGAQGEVKVGCTGGAWTTESSPIPGAKVLNFFLDFPEAATRNECAHA